MAYTKIVTSWEKVSEYVYAHVSGARIERRGYPDKPGWYLIGATGDIEQRFEPTPAGCDDAFVAFSGRAAAVDALTRLITR